MCGYSCTGFIDFMLVSKTLIDLIILVYFHFINLENDNIINTISLHVMNKYV